MLWVLKKMLPRRLKAHVRAKIAALKQPRMIYGYTDASGGHRARTRISDTCAIYAPEKITVGDNVFVGHFTILDGTGGLDIAEGAQIAGHSGIHTHGSHISVRLLGRHYQEIAEDEKPGYDVGRVTLGKYSFIGAGCTILPGVSIGNGALVGAGSVVNRDVPDFMIVQGNPAKVVGDVRKLDEPYLADEKIRQWYEEWQSVTDPAAPSA